MLATIQLLVVFSSVQLFASAFAPSQAYPAMAPARIPLRFANDGELAEIRESSAPRLQDSRREQQRKEWIDQAILYYSKVMREERRRALGQQIQEDPDNYVDLANKHYFALRKIKDGKPAHAEIIYRRIIDDLVTAEADEECGHAKLAVTTLLLALHLQREEYPATKTREVFLSFFRLVLHADDECACSAKVLQAFALFEMKQGNTLKSLHIVRRAIELDPNLRPVLKWKQFREAEQLVHARKQLRRLK
jgi:tetratricopeptide (TPR) repeat protein